jgi:hypothetical protein
MDSLALEQAIISSVSVIACSTILFTFYIFPDLRRKSFIATVFFICVCDLMASVGLALANLGESHVTICWVQGILVNFFTLASALWTVVICLMMYWIKIKGKVFVVNSYCHLFCWGVPAVSTFLPLVDSIYAYDYSATCQLAPHNSRQAWITVVWRYLGYYGVIWGAIMANMALLLVVYRQIRLDSKTNSLEEGNTSSTTKALYIALKKLCLYPTIMLIIYGETCFADLAMTVGRHEMSEQSRYRLQAVSAILPCLLGCLNSLAFWVSNPDIRHHLVLHLFSLEKQVISIPEHFFQLGKEGAMHSLHNISNNLAKVRPIVLDLEKAIEEQSLQFVDVSTRRASQSISTMVVTIVNSARKKSRHMQVLAGAKYDAGTEGSSCHSTDTRNITRIEDRASSSRGGRVSSHISEVEDEENIYKQTRSDKSNNSGMNRQGSNNLPFGRDNNISLSNIGNVGCFSRTLSNNNASNHDMTLAINAVMNAFSSDSMAFGDEPTEFGEEKLNTVSSTSTSLLAAFTSQRMCTITPTKASATRTNSSSPPNVLPHHAVGSTSNLMLRTITNSDSFDTVSSTQRESLQMHSPSKSEKCPPRKVIGVMEDRTKSGVEVGVVSVTRNIAKGNSDPQMCTTPARLDHAWSSTSAFTNISDRDTCVSGSVSHCGSSDVRAMATFTEDLYGNASSAAGRLGAELIVTSTRVRAEDETETIFTEEFL